MIKVEPEELRHWKCALGQGYVGTAVDDAVRWTVGRHYGWLEAEFGRIVQDLMVEGFEITAESTDWRGPCRREERICVKQRDDRAEEKGRHVVHEGAERGVVECHARPILLNSGTSV